MAIIRELNKRASYFSLEYVLENFDELGINFISINPDTFTTHEGDDTIIKEITNMDNPVGILNNRLYINKKYYIEHKDEVDYNLAKIIFKIKDKISFNGEELFTDNNLNVVACNNNISELELIDTSKEDKYLLTKEIYNRFLNNSHIKKIKTDGVEKELEDLFVPLIDYNYSRSLFDIYKYKDLKEMTFLWISNNSFDMYDTKYLNLLNDDCVIDIEGKDGAKLHQNIEIALKKIKSKNLSIHIQDKLYFNNHTIDLLKEYNTESITVYVDGQKYNLKQYIDYEKRLNDLIEPAMNLSPLERYLYAYNVVKLFKPYKEVESKDWNTAFQSRRVYELLDNDYMVCVGYANLLVDLLARLGINATDISVRDYTDFDENIQKYDQDMVDNIEHSYRFGGHARVEVKLEDPKYGVKGIYVADPTWNNDYEADLYTFALMTKKEHNSMYRENGKDKFVDTLDILLEANSIEEYYDYVNYYLNKTKFNSHEKEKNTSIKDKWDYRNAVSTIEKSPFSLDDITNIIIERIKANYLGDIYKNEVFVDKVVASISSLYTFDRIKTKEELINNLDKQLLKTYKDYLKYDYKKEQKEVINYILNYLKTFNVSLYEEIKNKYPVVLENAEKLNDAEFADIIEKTGDYVVHMNNNLIKGSTILEAVKAVYKVNGLTDEEIETKIEQTKIDNEKFSEMVFPKRRKIYADGTEEIYMNAENKFSDESKTK